MTEIAERKTGKAKQDYTVLVILRRITPICMKAVGAQFFMNLLVGTVHSLCWPIAVPASAALFDSIVAAVGGTQTIAAVLGLLALYGGILILQQVMNGIHNFHGGVVLFRKAEGALNRLIHQKAARIDPADYESPARLDDINKAREGARNAMFCTGQIFTTFIFYGPYIAFMAIYLYKLQPLLALAIPIIFVPLIATLFVRVTVFTKFEDAAAPHRRRYEAMEKSIADRDFFKETRILGAFSYFRGQYLDALRLLNKETWRAEFRTNLWELGLKILTVVGYAGILALLVRALLIGDITIGSFAAVLSSIMTVVFIVEELICRHFGSIAKGLGSVRNFLRFLDLKERNGDVLPDSRKNGIELSCASFRYPGAEKLALDGINLTVMPGETLAIVGGNGAGKTTLVRLMTGIFLPTEGSVRLRGAETRDIAPETLFDQTATVFQKYQRYRMTLGENVRIGDTRGAPDEDRARQSLVRADMPADDSSFPEGLGTMLSREFDGVDLSGGQWQRVAIARGFYRDHNIIILDEPTAAIDPLEEQKLYEKFAEISRGKTSIIVTHRLGSARIADRIIVMDAGRVDDIGTHEELMAAGGLYAQMFASQAQWYTKEGASLCQ